MFSLITLAISSKSYNKIYQKALKRRRRRFQVRTSKAIKRSNEEKEAKNLAKWKAVGRSDDSMVEGIDNGGDVDDEGGGDERDERRHRPDGGGAAAGQYPQADLDDVDHGEQQEDAPHHRTQRRGQHPEAERPHVDVRPERLVDVVAVEQIDGELEALGHQAREEEEAEGDHLEDQEVAYDIRAGVADGFPFEAPLARGGEGEPHEDGDGEERVHVHQPVQRRHVDARRAPRLSHGRSLLIALGPLVVVLRSEKEREREREGEIRGFSIFI